VFYAQIYKFKDKFEDDYCEIVPKKELIYEYFSPYIQLTGSKSQYYNGVWDNTNNLNKSFRCKTCFQESYKIGNYHICPFCGKDINGNKVHQLFREEKLKKIVENGK